jgi:histidinol phosphatase-like PHP family hydrolase
VSKAFSRELYDKNDWVKHLFIDILNSRYECNPRVNPDDYGIDILTDKYDYEVEVKHNWTGVDFPYDTIHYSSRKIKFVTKRSYFVTFNSDNSRYFIIHSWSLNKARIVTKNTAYTKSESFIEINVSEGWFYDVPHELKVKYK